MVDKRMALTFSVRNNPGVYALLVGSGISREAEVPTGWDIITDLIEKVAAADGETPEPNPVDWYENEYNEEPRYDDLLEQLAPSKDDRQALLESYFEPNEEERARGIKTPSKSHKNIAWLVKNGYIKIVVTTNFDRLLEQALKEEGITPTVISSPSDAEGAAPLAHQDAVILKINGDYKASRLKNTADELSSYNSAIEHLVEQVLDEYGLIVCGWSGGWDSALRDLILSAKNRRYSMYWASYSELSEEGAELVQHRDGTVISINGAGEFFSDLKERTRALQNAAPGAPLTKGVAQERTKRYLTREEHKIDLADLIHEETESLRDNLIDQDRFSRNTDVTDDEIEKRLSEYEKEVEILLSVFSTCAYWGPEVPNTAESAIHKSIGRLVDAKAPVHGGWYTQWELLARYPTTLLVYSIGIIATESENWDLVKSVLINTDVASPPGESVPLATQVHPYSVGRELNNGTTFLKERIKDTLRDPLRNFLPGKTDYEEALYEFGLLMDMLIVSTYAEMHGSEIKPARSVDRRLYNSSVVIDRITSEGEDWGPLREGVFDGSPEQAKELADYLTTNRREFY